MSNKITLPENEQSRDSILEYVIDTLTGLTKRRCYGRVEVILKGGKIVQMNETKDIKFD